MLCWAIKFLFYSLRVFYFVLPALKSHGKPDVCGDLVELRIKRHLPKLKFDCNSAKSVQYRKVNMPGFPVDIFSRPILAFCNAI